MVSSCRWVFTCIRQGWFCSLLCFLKNTGCVSSKSFDKNRKWETRNVIYLFIWFEICLCLTTTVSGGGLKNYVTFKAWDAQKSFELYCKLFKYGTIVLAFTRYWMIKVYYTMYNIDNTIGILCPHFFYFFSFFFLRNTLTTKKIYIAIIHI